MKVIVWLPFATWNDCCTCGAAFQFPFPPWSALIVQVPTETNVTLVPETEQTPGVADVKLTVRPELAVATTVRLSSSRLSAKAANEIVWLPFGTWNDCCTCGAAFQFALPPWSALIVQVPVLTNAIVAPFAPPVVQTAGVDELKLTVRPELAVATTVRLSSNRLSAKAANEIAWLPFVTWKDCCTCGAAFQFELPAWFAFTVQVPTDTNVTLVPATEHTPGVADENATAKPDDAVADTVTGLSSNRLSAKAANEIAWLPFVTWKDCCTCGAAFQLELPAWFAFTVQVPTETNDTLVPDTEHTAGVADENATAKPEVAVAPTVTGLSSNRLSANAAKADRLVALGDGERLLRLQRQARSSRSQPGSRSPCRYRPR